MSVSQDTGRISIGQLGAQRSRTFHLLLAVSTYRPRGLQRLSTGGQVRLAELYLVGHGIFDGIKLVAQAHALIAGVGGIQAWALHKGSALLVALPALRSYSVNAGVLEAWGLD